MSTCWEKNSDAIKQKNASLYLQLQNTVGNDDYSEVIVSKTQKYVPIFKTGAPLYSKYNPEKEFLQTFTETDTCVLFTGIASCIHISLFLRKLPSCKCLLTEINLSSLKRLLELVDITEILVNENVYLLPCIDDAHFTHALAEQYLPVIDGNLRVFSLRSWELFYKEKLPFVQKQIDTALALVKQDFSTQAEFGKIWLKNILKNLQVMAEKPLSIPICDTNKTALIVGAGPNLDKHLLTIKKERDSFVIFAAGTALLPLVEAGIYPDFFLSIDPQVFSLYQVTSLPKNCIGIFDLCTCSSLAHRFLKNTNEFFFTISNHPLCMYANTFVSIPFADTSSGTVAIYALDVAHRLGFSKIKTFALDFCYSGGKPYPKGTWLSRQIAQRSTHLFSTESFFSSIMFRSSIEVKQIDGIYEYTSPLLLEYAKAFKQYTFDGKIWKHRFIEPFPYTAFEKTLIQEYLTEQKHAHMALLPFLAYCKKHKINFSHSLVIDTILQYNYAL